MGLRRHAGTAAATAAILLISAVPAWAETYPVTRTDDPAPGACLPTDCSLREALNASNASTAVDDLVEIPAASAPYAVDLGTLAVTDAVVVRGAGADRVVIDGGEKDLLMSNDATGPVVLVGLTLRKGKGAIQNNGTLTLRAVSVEKNFRSAAGGGIQSNGPLQIESSFIGFNRTDGISGGGIHSNGEVRLINSTVAGNESMGPSGIRSNESLTLISSSVVSNMSVGSGYPGVSAPTLTLQGSLLAKNSSATAILNCGGMNLVSLGGNVEDGATCGLGVGDRAKSDPGLGDLGLHGGTTAVYALLPGGGAVDASPVCPPFDQRGALRPSGPGCDSGAYELQQEQPQPGGAPTGAVADTTVALGPIQKRLRINGRGVGRLTLTCPAAEKSPPCSGNIVIRSLGKVPFDGKSRRVVLAKGRFSLEAGESKGIRLEFANAKLTLLRSAPPARRALLRITVVDGAGNTALVPSRIRLQPAT
jgi:hypothetical protein